MAGVAEGLKENNNIITGLCDPMGSALYNFFKKWTFCIRWSIIEGIGTTRITENFKDAKVNEAFQIDDQYALILFLIY